jgi:hypothetical protein
VVSLLVRVAEDVRRRGSKAQVLFVADYCPCADANHPPYPSDLTSLVHQEAGLALVMMHTIVGLYSLEVCGVT